MRRLLAALGLAALLTGSGLAVSAPARAAACTGTSGVTVVVQSDSSPQVRCAPGDPSSAAAALSAAGFGITRVAPPNAGAICQIDAVPDTSCARMPPTSRYWAIFHAPAGGSWSYSSAGADSLDPAPGTVVGFRLGSGAAPSIAPPKVDAPPQPSSSPPPPARTSTSAPRPTSASTSRPAPRTATGSSTAAGAPAAGSTARPSSASRTSGSSGPSSATSGTSTTTSTKGASRSSSSTSGPPDGETPGAIPSSGRSASAGATAAGRDGARDSGSTSGPGALLPTLVGAALLLALGGGALVMARRRG